MNTIMPTQKTKKLALMGFGNAGRAFAKLLIEKGKQIEEKYGYNVIVTAIATEIGRASCRERV